MDHYKKVSVKHKFGTKVDSLNGVNVYYNGKVSNISGRSLTSDGYNLGLKYQCVEFVKRYYYEHLNHKMPNSYGNAKDFFNPRLKDGQMNHDRKLIQYTNGGQSLPKPKAANFIQISSLNDTVINVTVLYNYLGQKVMDVSNPEHAISVEGLELGVYLVEINTSVDTVIKRFIKK
jgi:hypothetical protein